jgi:hypothetical protein
MRLSTSIASVLDLGSGGGGDIPTKLAFQPCALQKRKIQAWNALFF